MILFEIDVDGVTIDKTRGNPPCAIYSDCKAFRFPLQTVEMPAGKVHILRHNRLFERIEQAQAFSMLVSTNLCTRSRAKEIA